MPKVPLMYQSYRMNGVNYSLQITFAGIWGAELLSVSSALQIRQTMTKFTYLGLISEEADIYCFDCLAS